MYVKIKRSLELLFSSGHIVIDVEGNWTQKENLKTVKKERSEHYGFIQGSTCIYF